MSQFMRPITDFKVGDYIESHSKIIYFIESAIKSTVRSKRIDIAYNIVNTETGESIKFLFSNTDKIFTLTEIE